MNNIYTALAAAQQEMGKAIKASNNPAFRSKYADLGAVMDACLEALNKNGICLTQPVEVREGGYSVNTILTHGESNTSVACPVPLIFGKNDMQGLGSAMTYARRYGLMALAGIAPEDDDGNAAAASVKDKPAHKPNPVGDAIREARADAFKDVVASGKVERGVKELLAELAECKTEEVLKKRWARSQKQIDWLQVNAPDLHTQLAVAYDDKMADIKEATREVIPL